MIYKTYGKTGKKVSAVGFGGMRFDTDKKQEENASLVLYAVEQGINYLDTAPGYCDDQSEIIMGQAIKQLKRDDFYISTKFMPTNAHNKQEFLDKVKKSRDRLNVDKIDFYHIWCLRKMEHYYTAIQSGMQYDALLEAQQQGLIEHIVCSSHQPGNEIRQIVEDGKVEGVLMGVNILNSQYRWEGVEACVENGLGIVAMNPLSGGAIPKHEQQLKFLCRDGESATEAALRFCISSPITITLNGFTTTEHIDTACRVADRAESFTDTEMKSIRDNLGENMNASCTGCGYCLKGCPEHINIAGYMQVYNEKQMFKKTDEEMVKLMKSQHNWGMLVNSTKTASDCIQCGQCERDCTQHLPIIERLKEMAVWEQNIQKTT
jgi:predicted aldo/keto reductase-like oxidoreductase